MKSPEDPIPKKYKGKFSKDQPGYKKKEVQKLCQNCTKWSPTYMHTPHNTEYCCKWSADSMQKFKPNKKCNFNSNNDHAMEGNVKARFAKIRKCLEKDMQKKSRSKKSKSKFKKYYGSSDSSDIRDSN